MSLRVWVTSVLAVIAWPTLALAGMPRITLTEIGEMRMQTLSFFAFLFFVSSWIVQRIWNGLQKDFPRLPRLGYWRATGLVALWGLLFLVVLTMISGARELLTPGAWEKNGLTYKLATDRVNESEEPRPSASLERRREKLERLKLGLQMYAWNHKGEFPANTLGDAVAPELWRVPDGDGAKYEYLAGQKISPDGDHPLAFEPPIFDGDLLVLYTNGEIKSVSLTELVKLHPAAGGGP